MPGKKGNARPQTKKRYARGKSIERQLKGEDCNHKGHVITQTNSSGKSFNECDSCGAFLGWC